MRDRTSRRELLVALSFAIWGLCIAIAMASVLRQPAPPDQPVSLATLSNVDARGAMRWMFCLMLFPLALPAIFRPVSRRLAAGEAWARNAFFAAPLVTLWLMSFHQNLRWAVLPAGVVLTTSVLLRNHAMHFTRRDFVLVPAFLAAWLALIDIAPRVAAHQHVFFAAMLVLALRIAVTFIRAPLPPALAFVVAPLGLVLQTGFFSRDQRYLGWNALALVVVTPFVLRVFLRREKLALRLMTFVVFPLALYAYANAINMNTAFGKPRINYFEDGHNLTPASEFLRGERPYRDVLPGHGLIEDGLFEYVVFQTGDVTAGRALKTRDIAGHLTAIGLYALAFAATGSAETGLMTVVLSMMMGTFTTTIRTFVPLVALAFVAAGVRLRRPRLFAWAGFVTVICGLTSLDYAFYTFVAIVVAMFLVGIRASIRPVAIGIAAGGVPLLVILAALGILGDFLRGTFFEIPAASSAYRMGFFRAPAAMMQRPSWPEVLEVLLDPQVYQYLVWPAIVVCLGAALTRRWSRKVQPLLILAVWVMLAGISFAYRFNHYFGMIAAVLLSAWIYHLVRRRSVLAVVVIGATIILCRPTIHASVVGVNRAARGKPPAEWVEIRDVPRARGALWLQRDARAIASVRRYLALTLKPDETFFNFTDTPILYYLTRRDMPIREYETAFIQSEEKQRETIRILQTNQKIRAVLMREGAFSIDLIPPAQRAPILHQYLLENFEPDFEEGDVAFWRRK